MTVQYNKSTEVHKLQHYGEVVLNHHLRQSGREGGTPELVGVLAEGGGGGEGEQLQGVQGHHLGRGWVGAVDAPVGAGALHSVEGEKVGQL